ncbi:uncharacterized protein C1orf112 homolog isoform X1 [Mya arenaria]|uniref:uncharacterized protein C1orf112 homolog isoform X1 n=1 Tax=Mya arenaria TaxID=6604 RepID=UPI0022E7B90C|nr:uncharacterized protein C1orf112 homolog isoform X1 [Mya arenaria]
MSQASFLEAVVAWNETQCRQNLAEALPKLISHLQEASALQEELGILKIICLSFLPWVEVGNAERAVFSHIAAKSCEIVDRVREELGSVSKQSEYQQQIQELLEAWSELLECFCMCVRYATDQTPNSVGDVHSLPYGAVHLLKGTYSHCKDSSDIYGDILANVTEPLSTLFKKAHYLQQGFIGLMENVVVDSGSSEQDVQDVAFVVSGLFEVCQVVTSLDVKLVVSLWKSISRLSGKHKQVLGDRLDVDVMVTHLCVEIGKGHVNMLQLAPPAQNRGALSLSQCDSAGFQKSLKVVGYHLRVVISLLDNYVNHLSTCVPHVVRLIINICRGLHPTLDPLSISEGCKDDLKRHLVNGIEPLVNLLVTNRTFVNCVLKWKEDSVTDDSMPYTLLLVKVLDSLPKHGDGEYSGWMKLYSVKEETTNVVQVLFTELEKCHVELSTGLSVPGNRDLPLYEFICTHVCGFVGSLPARFFPVLEECLLDHLFSGFPQIARLAVDVWCFLARYGSADLCYQHTTFLMNLLSSVPEHADLSKYWSNVVSLTRRLIKFLAPDHQTKLLGQFPMDGFPQLWCNVFIPILHNHADKNMLDSAIHSACQGISGFLDKGQNTYSDLLLLHTQLNLLSKLLAHCNEKVHLPVTIETVSHLWLSWEPEMIQEAVCIQCLIKMTESAASVVVILENSVILKILELLTACTKEGHVKMKAHTCRFLQSCRKKTFEPDSKQPQVLSLLANLFHSLLTDNDPAIKYLALQAFTQFAETTPHEGLVPECLADEQALQDNVVAFLSKTNNIPSSYTERDFLQLQQYTLDQLSNRSITIEETEVASRKNVQSSTRDMLDDISSNLLNEQPSSKRKRCEETPVDDEATTAIDGLDNAVKVLEKLVQDETFTSSDSRQTYIQRLKHIHCRLNGVIEKWE